VGVFGSVLGSVMGVWRWNDWRMMVVHMVPVDYLTFEQSELGSLSFCVV